MITKNPWRVFSGTHTFTKNEEGNIVLKVSCSLKMCCSGEKLLIKWERNRNLCWNCQEWYIMVYGNETDELIFNAIRNNWGKNNELEPKLCWELAKKLLTNPKKITPLPPNFFV